MPSSSNKLRQYNPRECRLLVEGRPGALIRHLEEQQIGELLDVVAVGEPIIAKEVAVVPQLLDDLSRVAHVLLLTSYNGVQLCLKCRNERVKGTSFVRVESSCRICFNQFGNLASARLHGIRPRLALMLESSSQSVRPFRVAFELRRKN